MARASASQQNENVNVNEGQSANEPDTTVAKAQPAEDFASAAEAVDNQDELVQAFYAGNFPAGHTIRFETRSGETVAVIEKV